MPLCSVEKKKKNCGSVHQGVETLNINSLTGLFDQTVSGNKELQELNRDLKVTLKFVCFFLFFDLLRQQLGVIVLFFVSYRCESV